MGVTTVRVGVERLRSLLFGGLDVEIDGIYHMDGSPDVMIGVRGRDVPDCETAKVVKQVIENIRLVPVGAPKDHIGL